MKPAVGAVASLAMLAVCACASAPAISPPAAPQTFATPQVAQGAALAKLGDCQTCHTAEDGRPYAGGRPIGTPFGQVFATNITPDRETGIGGYSQAAFRRAMRQGLRRDGAQLYPAFPYDHFSYAADADFDALYAFLMSREPMRRANTPNRLVPPVGFRPVVAIWKALYFRPEPFRPTSGKSDEWNRGAYLVQSFGHCGACHTPHNWLGAEDRKRPLDGGYAEGWYAPPLNGSTPASVPWTEASLTTYLRTGLDVNHAASAGPMGEVAHELARAPERDVHAIAVYLADLMNRPARSAPVDRAARATEAHPEGATLYVGACANCHDAGAPMMREGRPPLPLGTPLHEDDPRDTIQIVLQGLKPPVGAAGPFMPAFAATFTDAQVAEIAAYLRARYSDRPAWRDLPHAVAKARKEAAA
ncbi:MAG: c-type cytochrome [Phenylobacterium sp.]